MPPQKIKNYATKSLFSLESQKIWRRNVSNSGAPAQLLPIHYPVDGKLTSIEIIDGAWFHIGGIGYSDHAKNKIELCQHLDEFLDKGGAWNELIQ